MAGVKRTREFGTGGGGRQSNTSKPLRKEDLPEGPFIPMFSTFRNELDTHHDRRERIIKASRDITALSKKMIFSLQRARISSSPSTSSNTSTNTAASTAVLSQSITRDLHTHETKIQELLKSVSNDLQGINAHRYARQISGGLQEYVEALSFRHYVMKGCLISYEEACEYVAGRVDISATGGEQQQQDKMDVDSSNNLKEEDGGDTESPGKKVRIDPPTTAPVTTTTDEVVMQDTTTSPPQQQQPVHLPQSDYLLGLFDLVGEIMRFAITSIATTPVTPGATSTIPVLTHLRELRAGFESLEAEGGGPLARDIEKKMDVMRQCVEKVEMAMYGRVVRGSERPEGWVMTGEEGGWGGGGGGGRDDDE